MSKQTWTITFGECVENHAGMVKHGTLAKEGFSRDDLASAKQFAESKGLSTEFYDLSKELPEKYHSTVQNLNDACILIIRNGIKMFFDNSLQAPTNASSQTSANININTVSPAKYTIESFDREVRATKNIVDKKALMYGRVVNKHARHNLCFADTKQAPNYAQGLGTIVPFEELPNLQHIRNQLEVLVGPKAKQLFAELNYYYDTTKCGIGFHGDAERRALLRFVLDLIYHCTISGTIKTNL